MAEGPAVPVRRDPLTRQVYSALRERIIRGHDVQGARLGEQRLAQELQVSRVPLRESFPLLEMDGFVRTSPHRGAAVVVWDDRSVDELFDLRLCLEVGAARFAARRVSRGASAQPLRDALEDARVVLAARDPYLVAEASTRFHEAVVEMTGNELMRSLMRSMTGRMMWLFYLTSDLDLADAHEGHEKLCAVIASGDERAAEAVAYTHIESDRAPTFASLGFRRPDGGAGR